MSKFDELMATLNSIDAEAEAETLTKALPQEDGEDDQKIQAAAEEAEGDDKEDKDDKGEGEGEALEKCDLKKSFTNEEGEELIDATEILEGLQKSFADQEGVLLKALPQMAGMIQAQNKQLKEQGELIKSMQETLASFGNRGAGRKSTVTVLAKSHAATQNEPAKPEQVSSADIMLKAHQLFDQKLMTGIQLTKLDVSLRNGFAPDADVLALLAKH
ncbi:hypothetical protein VPZ60_004267 [Salmonella enterica]|nr:hypothetical protein [Salmonella enterica]